MNWIINCCMNEVRRTWWSAKWAGAGIYTYARIFEPHATLTRMTYVIYTTLVGIIYLRRLIQFASLYNAMSVPNDGHLLKLLAS